MKYFCALVLILCKRLFAQAAPDVLKCSCCGRAIHKRERFVILTAQHRNCLDTKMTGQLPLIKED